MKIKSVFSVGFLFFVAVGYALLQHNSMLAETIEKTGQEHVHEETVEVKDSVGNIHEDTLLIVTDTLFIEKPELGIVDTIPYADTLNLTEEHEKQKDSIRTTEQRNLHYYRVSSFPNLFHHPLSHTLITEEDSAKVMKYLMKEAFPHKKYDRYFKNYALYKNSDEFDVRKNTVLIQSSFGGARIHAPFAIGLFGYMNARFRENLYELMIVDIDEAEQLRIQERQSQGIIPDIEFPKIKMPKAMQRFFGDNIGRLKVTGSQKITIGGSVQSKTGEAVSESAKKGFFPDLKMEQKLNLGISGTIGKKIKVDVKQMSDESIFESNKISIKYEGDEDDPIKLIDVGDTQLSLSGSGFLGSPASSGDLFGIKGKFEFGKLKLTTIISQQEGQQASASATGNAVEQETDYLDKGFYRNKFFLFDEPQKVFTDSLGNPVEPDTLPMTEWYYDPDKVPISGSVRVFVFDGSNTQEGRVTGYDVDDHSKSYQFYELENITEFLIDYDNSPYMLQMGVGISDNYIIGVIYTDNEGQHGGWPQGGELEVKIIKGNYNQGNNYLEENKWDYQFKNIYYLGGRNIDRQGFDLKIFYENSKGELIWGVKDSTSNVLDKFIDILDLDTNKDGVVNDDDETVDLDSGTIQFRMWEPFMPHWFLESDSSLGSPEVYSQLNPRTTEYNPFKLRVKSKQTGGKINLGHINIIEGSEKVYVNGDLMKKNTDYTIDYFSGTVRLIGEAASDPNAVVKIDYEYKPIFALEKKSMFGVRADYEFNDNAKVGATFMYEGASAGNRHVKVGGEPTKTFVGDIDGSVKTELPFVTNLVNMIPLVRTNEKSTIRLSGEVAMNIPNPNATDKGEAYIDDMEAVNEVFSLGIGRSDYVLSSYPVGYETLMTDSLVTRGNFIWYNPHDTYRKSEIYPDLPTDEGNEYVTVLECKLEPLSHRPNWGGLMKSFGSTLDEFYEKEYLELTLGVKDAHAGDTLFINLGTISEDFYPILDPNEVKNTEDLNGDGVLDAGEDTGLDNVSGTDPVPPKSHITDDEPGIDDGNDDNNYDPKTNPTDYSTINNAEGNKTLDTEDIDRSGGLDIINNYLQYAIDLTNVDPEILISENDDWMFLRIPLQDSLFFAPVDSSVVQWDHIAGARLWMKTETYSDLTIDVETFDAVGNKWVASTIMDTTLHKPLDPSPDEVFEVATENNENNLDYTPPPGSLVDDNSDEKEIEQSLVLKIENLEPNRYIYARENFSDKFDLLNYSKLKFWVYAQQASDAPPNASSTETIVFRIGADTSNYYEYRQEIPVYDDYNSTMLESRWQDITIDFSQFTDMKQEDVPDTTAHFRIVGSPSLGYVKQIAVGLIRPDSMETTFTGRIFFDDIRVADAYAGIGMAARITLNTKLADFADFQIKFEKTTPNFYSLGETGGSNADRYSYSIDNKLYLQKFLPEEWGFNIPLKFDYFFSESKPRFEPNSDVKLTTAEEKEKYKTLKETKNATISIRKTKASSNFFSRIFLDKTNISATANHSTTLSPTKKDSTYKYSGTFSYTLDVGKKLLTWKILKKDKFNIYFVPQKIVLYTNYSYTKENSWSRTVEDSVYIDDEVTPEHTLSPKLTVNYEPFTDFDTDYVLDMTRDLTKKNKVGKINIGIETSRTQDVTLEYVPNYLNFFNFNTKYKTNYKQNRRENASNQNDTTTVQYEVTNERTASANITLKFNKWGADIMEIIEVEEVIEEDGGEEIIEEEKEIPEIDEAELADLERKKELEKQSENLNIGQEEVIDSVEVEIDTPEGEEEITIEEEGHPPISFKKVVRYVTQVVGFGIKTLGKADFSYTNTNKTKYYVSPDSLPDIYYQLGLRDQSSGSIQSSGQSDAFTASTRTAFELPLFKTGLSFSTDVSAKYTVDLTKASANKTKSESITLPGVTLGLSGLDDFIKAKFMAGSNLSTSFTRMISNTGNGFWTTPDQKTEKFQFAPLLAFSTKLFKKVSTNINLNYNFSNQIIYNQNNKKNKTNDLSVGITFRYSFQSAKGIKIPLLGRLKMTNKTDMDLDISYSSSAAQYTNTSDDDWIYSSHKNTISVKPRISYNFSRDINAGLTASYNLEKDIKTDTSTATTAINIWVEFKF